MKLFLSLSPSLLSAKRNECSLAADPLFRFPPIWQSVKDSLALGLIFQSAQGYGGYSVLLLCGSQKDLWEKTTTKRSSKYQHYPTEISLIFSPVFCLAVCVWARACACTSDIYLQPEMSPRLLRTTWRCADTRVAQTEGAQRAGDEGSGLETRKIGSCIVRHKYCVRAATGSPLSFPAAHLPGHNSECFSVPSDDRGAPRFSRQCRR